MAECNQEDFGRLRRLEQLCQEWLQRASREATSGDVVARVEDLAAAAAAASLSAATGPLPDAMRTPVSRGSGRPTVAGASSETRVVWEVGVHLELVSTEPLNLVRV